MTDNEIFPSIAKTIQTQIGRHAFIMMGAKNLIDTGTGLTWKIGRNSKKITHVGVELASDDTYTVSFIRVRKPRGGNLKVETVEKLEGIYVDSLHTVIESGTGLYLSL